MTQDTQDAADIVLVVDESGSMINEQTWLLVMVPFLEEVLTSAGTCSSDICKMCMWWMMHNGVHTHSYPLHMNIFFQMTMGHWLSVPS